MTITDRRALMCLIAGALVAISAPGCQPDAGDDRAGTDSTAVATTGDNPEAEAVSTRFVDEVFNKGNLAYIDSAVAPDCIEHAQMAPGQEQGIPGMKKWIGEMRSAYPDMVTTVEHIISEGDLVAMHIRQIGTNSGPFMGMPATNKKIDMRGIDFMRFANGKVVEHWGYYEEVKMMQQLGLMPAMPGMPGGPPTSGGKDSATTGGALDTAASGDTTKK